MTRKLAMMVGLVALIGAAVALVGCDGLPTHEATRTLEGSYAVTGAVDLDVFTSNGRVTVQGVEGQTTVEVIATIRSRGDTQIDAAARVAQVTVGMLHNGNHIELEYDAGEHSWDVRRYTGVEFEITVPTTVDVAVGTSNGKVAVSDVVGILDLDTSNGKIDVADAIGELHASTSNGRIDITLAPDASLRIEARTSNASIQSNLPWIGDTEGKRWSAVLNPPATTTLTLETSNGQIEILGAL